MSWEENYKEIDSVPPSNEIHVALYLQYLMGLLSTTPLYKMHYMASKGAHNTAGLSDPCEADIVRRKVEASKRELNRPIKI